MGDLGWMMRRKTGTQSHNGMRTKDLIWLTALGLGLRGGFDLERLSTAIDEAAGRLWAPVLDVLAGCLEEMARSGAIRLSEEGFVTTPQGRQIMSLLMILPPNGPAGCPLNQVCLRLKMAFLDLIPADGRRSHLSSIIDACRGELDECRRRCSACSGLFARHWMLHEEEKLTRDLTLLLSLKDVSSEDGLA